MNKTTFTITAIVSLVFITIHAGYAQDTSANKFPKAVLVQLRSEHNRIEAATKMRRYKDVEEIKKDAISVQTKMIADFQDHFTYCPVYYYMDTNIYLIKNRVFNGVLMNADGTPAPNVVINDTSTDYLIVFYGYPVTQSRSRDVITDPKAYTTPEPNSKGLVLNNYKFQQVAYISRFEYQNSLQNHIDKKYKYLSKHFDIEYFPMAQELVRALINHRTETTIDRIIWNLGSDPKNGQ